MAVRGDEWPKWVWSQILRIRTIRLISIGTAADPVLIGVVSACRGQA